MCDVPPGLLFGTPIIRPALGRIGSAGLALLLSPLLLASVDRPAETICQRSVPSDSKTCLICHDGTLAGNVAVGRPTLREIGRMGSHPVMVSYEEAYARDPEHFIAPALLDPGIALLNGEVHCMTCHSPAAPGGQVQALAGASLCLRCHCK